MGKVDINDGECDVDGGADDEERGDDGYEVLGNLQLENREISISIIKILAILPLPFSGNLRRSACFQVWIC